MVRKELRSILIKALDEARALLDSPDVRVEGFRILATTVHQDGTHAGVLEKEAGWNAIPIEHEDDKA